MYGERIKELREERDMSQEKLAKLLCCNQQTISKYEREVRDLGTQTIINLCRIFEVSADYLLGLEDDTGAKKFR